MKRNSSMPGLFGLLGVAAVSLALLVIAAACTPPARLEHLVQRAEAAIAENKPHPSQVPAPFTPSNGDILPANADPKLILAQAVTPTVTTAPATAEPAATTAPQPSDTPASVATATAAPLPTATPAYKPAQASVALTGLAHYWQTWNNCGPATLAMNLSYYKSTLSQDTIAATLRPDKDDKNTNPWEMVSYAKSQGFEAIYRINGNTDRLKLLLSNGIPVLVETWMEPKPNDGMGHYRLLTGYDDAARFWIAYDSYESTGVDPKQPYAGIHMPYDEMNHLWDVFNRTYVVVYTAEQAPIVQSIVGGDMEDAHMWQTALAGEEALAKERPNDAFVWFNIGTDLVGQGQYQQAATAYDEARRLGLPWRMLWYQFGPFEAYYKVGRNQEVTALADATLATAGNIEELYYWKGLALQAEGNTAGARQAYETAIKYNANYQAPAQALAELGQ